MEQTLVTLTEAIQYQLRNGCAYREFLCPGRLRQSKDGTCVQVNANQLGRPLAESVLESAGRFQRPSDPFLKTALHHLTIPPFGRFRAFPYGISVSALPPSDQPPLRLMDIARLVENVAHTGTVADVMWLLSQDVGALPSSTMLLAPMYPLRTHHDGENPTYLFERIHGTTDSAPAAEWLITPFDRDLVVRDPRWPVPIVVFTHACPERMFPTTRVFG